MNGKHGNMRRVSLCAAIGLAFGPAAWAGSTSASADALGSGAPAQASTPSSLRSGFETPPESARPRVWWHWMNGNVTASGVEKDLAWMHRAGIGGVNVVQASIGTPVVVEQPAVYLSPAWAKDFRLAGALTKSYGMEFGTDSSPGWSETGGPWVTPGDAMKKLVWTRTVVDGGKPFTGRLPPPPSNTGPFQNAPMDRNTFNPVKFSSLKYYRDAIVIAYKEPVADPVPVSGTLNSHSISAASLAELSDGSLVDGMVVPVAEMGGVQIVLRYSQPRVIQGAELAISATGTRNGVMAKISASQDGEKWHTVARARVEVLSNVLRFPQTTVAFPPVTARYVRIDLAVAPKPALPPSPGDPKAPGSITISDLVQQMESKKAGARADDGSVRFQVHEIRFYANAVVNRFAAKADFVSSQSGQDADLSTAPAKGTVVDGNSVVDLTSKMKADGELDWTPPPGRWVILRMGYSLEGTTNHPAAESATGLEVDKLNREDVDQYLTHYLDLYKSKIGPLGQPGSLNELTVDSTEVGMQNWTNGILKDFQTLSGYSPLRWLPVLTGAVVDSRSDSNRFLWDFRHVINSLLAENHYKEISNVARANGLTTYVEALESDLDGFGNDLQMRRYADAPMGAMWAYGSRAHPYPVYLADLRGAESVADIYGKRYVAAESMTSANQPWAYAPRELKPIIDREFTLGVNRVFIHESAAQPLDKPPGQSLWNFGQMFDRLDVWANYARPWDEYIARCSYLLQQGRHVAEIAYFFGQNKPLVWTFYDKRVDIPAGYGYDFVDADAVDNQLSTDHGNLVTRSGMHFKLLYLGGSSEHMTLDVLRHLAALVRAGAIVAGEKPIASPSLADNQAQFARLATELFGDAQDGTERHVGKGLVVPARSVREALGRLGVQPDFSYSGGRGDVDLRFIHKRMGDGDIYFISNRKDEPVSVAGSFEIAGAVPWLWNAVTGSTRRVNYEQSNGRTTVPLHLPPYGSIFVVFHDSPHGSVSATLPPPLETTVMRIHGPWKVSFEHDRGAPPSTSMAHLAAWNDNSDKGIKYFSGVGTYTKTFELASTRAGSQLYLDLGQVWELASVDLNGKHVGIVWTPPFRLNITKYVHAGANTLSISVANLWANRLIGDAQPGTTKKYTSTSIPTYRSDAPLRRSGLLGPVEIVRRANSP